MAAVAAVAGATVAAVAANSDRSNAGAAPSSSTPAPRPTAFSPADLRQINPEKFTASVLANLPPVR